MMFRNAARVVVLLSVATAMAQSALPAQTVPGGPAALGQQGLAGRRVASPGATRSSGVQTENSLRLRMEDLENTLNQMHAVMKQMHARAAKSTVKDSAAKTNLEMWELVVGHLDKELQALRVAVAVHEDMEARRATLYKQADQKAEAQAQAARAALAAKSADRAEPQAPGAQNAQSPAGQTAPGQSSTPPANNSSSPN